MTDEIPRPTLLLVHGAWHGAWCWKKLTAVLNADGWRTRTVDLPSAGGRTGLRDDACAIRAELEDADGPVVVVAHSYGGIPASEAAHGVGNVRRLVYLAAYQLDAGESLLGFHGAPQSPQPDGFVAVPENPIAMFYGDVARPDAEEAAKQLVPQSAKSFGDVLTKAGWHSVPSTYIICEKDQALPPQSQQVLAARSGVVHRVAWSHSPFLSRPVEFAALLTAIAEEADA